MTLHQTDRLGGVHHIRLAPLSECHEPMKDHPRFKWYSALGVCLVLISALGVLLGIAVALGW